MFRSNGIHSARAASLVLVAFLPTVARSGELLPTFAGSVLYEDNVFRSVEDPVDDFILRATPTLRLRDERERIRYELSYWFPLERGLETNRRFELDHNLGGKFTYQPGIRTRLSGRWGLRISSTLGEEREDVETDQGTALEVSLQEHRVIRNSATMRASHRFGQQLSGTFSVSHRLFDTAQENRSNSQTLSADGRLNYTINARNAVGGGFGVTRQAFANRRDTAASATFFYRAFASWTYQFSESLSLTVNGGPTLVSSQQDSPDRVFSGVAAFPFTAVEDPVLIQRGADLVVLPPGSLLLNRFSTCATLVGDPTTRVLVRGSCGGIRALANDPVNFPEEVAAIEQIVDPASGTARDFVSLEFAPGDEPPGRSDSRFTLFGSVSLRKRWSSRLVSALNYRRSESDASGLGGSTVLDSISLTNNWQPNRRWKVLLRLDWNQRKSLFPQTRAFQVLEEGTVVVNQGQPDEVTFDDIAKRVDGPGGLVAAEFEQSVDSKRWGAALRITRQLGRNASTSLTLRYNKQQSRSGSSGASSDFDNFIAQLGFRYVFDPIRLW